MITKTKITELKRILHCMLVKKDFLGLSYIVAFLQWIRSS